MHLGIGKRKKQRQEFGVFGSCRPSPPSSMQVGCTRLALCQWLCGHRHLVSLLLLFVVDVVNVVVVVGSAAAGDFFL